MVAFVLLNENSYRNGNDPYLQIHGIEIADPKHVDRDNPNGSEYRTLSLDNVGFIFIPVNITAQDLGNKSLSYLLNNYDKFMYSRAESKLVHPTSDSDNNRVISENDFDRRYPYACTYRSIFVGGSIF